MGVLSMHTGITLGSMYKLVPPTLLELTWITIKSALIGYLSSLTSGQSLCFILKEEYSKALMLLLKADYFLFLNIQNIFKWSKCF